MSTGAELHDSQRKRCEAGCRDETGDASPVIDLECMEYDFADIELCKRKRQKKTVEMLTTVINNRKKKHFRGLHHHRFGGGGQQPPLSNKKRSSLTRPRHTISEKR